MSTMCMYVTICRYILLLKYSPAPAVKWAAATDQYVTKELQLLPKKAAQILSRRQRRLR